MTDTKIIGILQPSYLPWLGYFEQMDRSDVFVFYDDVQFEKGSWRNRNRIKTPQGAQWLTVPVLTKHNSGQMISEVLINSSVPWAQKQIKSIKQNYGQTPYFPYYSDDLFKIMTKPWLRLLDLNIALITWLCQELGIETKIVRSSTLGLTGDRQERLIRIIRHFGGNVFYEGAAGRSYIEVDKFEQAGIDVWYQDYTHPVYNQPYGVFIPYLSIIDLLFNHGPESLTILRQ